jgi:adenylate kinase family enzyme
MNGPGADTMPPDAADAPAADGAAPTSERELHRARVSACLRGESVPMPGGRLAELADRFGLGTLEADTLAVLWTCAFDAALRAELASLEPFTGQLTVRLICTLCGHAARVRLPSEAPLLTWQMVQEHPLIDGGAALAPDPAILAWLEGGHELDRALAGRVQLLAPGPVPPQWPVADLARRLFQGLQRGLRWRVHLSTGDALAAGWHAAALGTELGLPVLAVAPAACSPAASPLDPDLAVRLQRQAFLDGAIPYMAASELALSQLPGVPPYPLQIVHGAGALPPPPDGTLHLECALAPPDAAERERLWRALWPECAAWAAHELTDLALCHETSAGDIAAAAATAPASAGEAARALRERTRGDLSPLARRIDGRFGWDDLVLPEASAQRLREIAFEARERARVWADPAAARLFPYGRGLVALFAGPPGTGKTMAAQVIANDLGLDLLAVDLSAVVSKWVGETAQHLQQLLGSQTARRAVLFFDEADALYAKRVEEVRDAQDRFANLDSSHLMTALESYPGIVLLATNLRGNIDSAFLRRIRHVVEFAKPDAPARERIWRQVVQVLFPAQEAQRLDPELARLAQVEATGAVIKHAALSALFAVRYERREADLRVLGAMLARELAKEGAGLSPRELDALTGGRA